MSQDHGSFDRMKSLAAELLVKYRQIEAEIHPSRQVRRARERKFKKREIAEMRHKK